MYEHAGASCLLSVLIVIVFAVLLHENEATPPAPEMAKVVRPTEEGEPRSPAASPPPPIPKAAAIDEVPGRPAPPVVVANHAPAPAPLPVPVVTAPPSLTVAEPAAGRTEGAVAKARVVGRRTDAPAARPKEMPRPKVVPRRPRSSFAEVGPGESLVDVATRVYGTPDAVKTLWRANRDRIASPDAPVSAGTWLRTP